MFLYQNTGYSNLKGHFLYLSLYLWICVYYVFVLETNKKPARICIEMLNINLMEERSFPNPPKLIAAIILARSLPWETLNVSVVSCMNVSVLNEFRSQKTGASKEKGLLEIQMQP